MSSTPRAGVNGFGRIGRLVLRAALETGSIQVVAINDPFIGSDPAYVAYLLTHDTAQGRFVGDVNVEADQIVVNGQSIRCFAFTNPVDIPWQQVGAEYVVEASGKFTTREGAAKHLNAGARKVIVSAPAKDVPMFVVGVNHSEYDPSMDVVSNASCTTNCLAPLAKILDEHFGIEHGLMSTIHAVTGTQRTVDGPSNKDWRRGRSALGNVIPTSTGAARAVGKVYPKLEGKITGLAYRVPLAVVSIVDFTAVLQRPVTLSTLCEVMRAASEHPSYRGIVGYTDDAVVATDMAHSAFSTVFDAEASIVLSPTFVKIVAWYDNEWGYSNRLVELIAYMAQIDHSVASSEDSAL
ncbi:hypothetical protein F1559_002627 [Cyanidiococcus yangmingshanensis]|uniref:Glyceraldehyde-3-phosphate dehydrogenase n=1 Tax=Cyanidiococcus yangmingshanensis TaxID=2690220 RepID=A0A7J7IKH0_9RHOD|nr:hypothetical protein F1559_002627 [Cyanidiococcus yangmingshanensis]